MKTKSLILALAASCVSKYALATHQFYQSGTYVGVHIGQTYGWGKFDTVSDLNPTMPLVGPGSAKVRNFALLGGLSIGYQSLMANAMTVGINLQSDFYSNNALTSQTENNYNGQIIGTHRNKIKRNYSITPSINIGKVFVNRYHVYVGLGINYSQFQFDVMKAGDRISQNKKSNKFAFVPALGLDYAVTDRLALSGKVSYEHFNEITMTADGSTYYGLAPEDASYSSKIKPKFVTAQIGIKYKF